MSPACLPGDLVSPVAGALLRRGCPVRISLLDEEGKWFDAPAVFLEEANAISALPGFARVWDVASDTRAYTARDITALDLTDPAGMDRAARWLAAHHGLTVGATAPGWEECRVDNAGRWEPACRAWALGIRGEARLFFLDGVALAHQRAVPGISALTDPAEALRAACMAAVGRTG